MARTNNSTATTGTVVEIATRKTRGPRKEKPATITVLVNGAVTHMNVSIDGGKGMSIPMPLETIKSTVWDMIADGSMVQIKLIDTTPQS